MPVDRRKIALYAIAANLRLVVFLVFPGIPDLLTGQVEVSTPVSSFKRRTSNRGPEVAAN
jgi:phosphatidylinositol glycan class U